VATISSIGSYQVLSTLGKGAHSTILHVRRKADSREYALKIVSIDGAEEQKFLEQAKHEFRVAGMISHPNLIKIHALEMKKDWLFRVRKAEMLIEYVNGKTLDSVPVPNDQFVPLFYQVAAGLRHMHLRNVYHADLKPNNIMYGKRGEVKVIDYGLAWIKGEQKDRVQGTPEYMAPETFKSKVVNERSDIYNFGATMYRIATLKLPPSACATNDTLRVGAKAHAELLSPVAEHNKALPKVVCDLIQRCLNFDPNRRPENFREILIELKAAAKVMGTPVSDDDSE
jgi:eukaryotic-like serine/threonine-protein kinase